MAACGGSVIGGPYTEADCQSNCNCGSESGSGPDPGLCTVVCRDVPGDKWWVWEVSSSGWSQGSCGICQCKSFNGSFALEFDASLCQWRYYFQDDPDNHFISMFYDNVSGMVVSFSWSTDGGGRQVANYQLAYDASTCCGTNVVPLSTSDLDCNGPASVNVTSVGC